MPKNRGAARDETEYSHFSPGATGLHHLHGHRSTLLSERTSAALVLDLPPSRAGAFRGGSSKVDSATRSQLFGMLSLLAVAALWGSSSPVLKFLFSQPDPPSAALMTAAQALLAAAFLLAGTLAGPREARALGGGAGSTAPAPRPQTGALGPGTRLSSSLRLVLARMMRSAIRSGAATWRQLTGLGGGRRRELLLPARRTQLSGGGAELPPTAPQQQQQQHPLESGSGRVAPHPIGDLGDVLRDQDAGPGAAASGISGGGRPSLSLPLSPPLKGTDSGSVWPGGAGEGPPLGPEGGGGGAGQAHGSEGGGQGGSGRGWTPCPSPGHSTRRSPNLLAVPLRSLVAVGLELGTYNFCAAALGTWGLQRISATKVAFLGQATSLITPLLVALSGQRVALVVWAACCCGVLGATLVAVDGSSRAAAAAAATAAVAVAELEAATPPLLLAAADLAASAGAVGGGGSTAAAVAAGVSRAMRLEAGAGVEGTGAVLRAAPHPGLAWARGGGAGLPPALSQESMGANYVLASCVFYALGTVRLGVHSGRFPPLDLAAAGALVYAALSGVWLLTETLGTPTGGQTNLAVVARLLRDNAALALVLWAGLGPGALSSYLQVVGQRIVPAARAQMLYSSTPFWSALIARLLLGARDGGMGPMAWLGGSVMLGASLLASLLDARHGAASRGVSAAAGGTGTGAAGAAGHGHGGVSGMGAEGSPIRSRSRWSAGGTEGEHEQEAERDL